MLPEEQEITKIYPYLEQGDISEQPIGYATLCSYFTSSQINNLYAQYDCQMQRFVKGKIIIFNYTSMQLVFGSLIYLEFKYIESLGWGLIFELAQHSGIKFKTKITLDINGNLSSFTTEIYILLVNEPDQVFPL